MTMNKLDWIKSVAGHQTGMWGAFRAEVASPSGPLGFSTWQLYRRGKNVASGGTSSVRQSKKAAQNAVWRLLRREAITVIDPPNLNPTTTDNVAD